MAFTIPDSGEGDVPQQSVFFQEDLDVLVAGLDGIDCVLSGCAVTGGADMTPAVAKGAVLTNGVLKPVSAADVTIGTADSTNPRFDLIVVDSSGAKQVRAGTAAAVPKPPARTANDVVLAQVYVPASDTAIGATQIYDRRVFRRRGPILVHKVTSPVTFNTTSAIQTYVTLVVPNGMFTAGQVLRVRCGGNMLANSGTPAWTLTIAYGGTTMFADATAVAAADTDRKAWLLEFDIIAQGASDQALIGQCQIQELGAATQATTGFGDMTSDEQETTTALAGSAAVDSDSADRTLTVQWTMSVSNAAVETVLEYATVELL